MPTVLPSSTSTSESVPAAGAGISVSTLSVEISKSGSSRSTRSPGFLRHLVNVPSTMLSPIWGITTSVIDQLSGLDIRSGHVALKHAAEMKYQPFDHFFSRCARAHGTHGCHRLRKTARHNVLKV